MTQTKPRVLLVDNEVEFARDTAVFISNHFICDVAATADEALALARRVSYALALLDIDLGTEENGIDLLVKLKAEDPGIAAVMLTVSENVDDIVRSIQAGAFYYVVKGTEAAHRELIHIAGLAIEDARQRRALAYWEEDDETPRGLSGIVGSSGVMERVREEIVKIAAMDCNVLVTGESGTGKELVARALHDLSPRSRSGNFVPVDCAVLDKERAQNELFGHEPEGFSGALTSRIGKFQHADKGTLFLDEIADMPLDVQPMVLRAVEYKEFGKVGDARMHSCDVRIVSATHFDPRQLIDEGTFRNDLYQRLHEARIRVPSLREHLEDVPELARYLAAGAGEALRKGRLGISHGAAEALAARDWVDGNVRELRNTITRAAVRCRGDVIQTEDLLFDDGDPDAAPEDEVLGYSVARDLALRRFQTDYFTRLLTLTHGNVAAAARLAGMTAPAVFKILKRIELDPAPFKD
jgi:DNA-binding NtrC family response regulator